MLIEEDVNNIHQLLIKSQHEINKRALLFPQYNKITIEDNNPNTEPAHPPYMSEFTPLQRIQIKKDLNDV